MTVLGVLHPGSMGASLAACARANGVRVLWASAGRSEATHRRAREEGLQDAGTLAALAAQSDIVLSICPPHAAEALAGEVLAAGFDGLFCDANAIAPETARRIAGNVEDAGGRFADGGVVGPPARSPGQTRLYLSGAHAAEMAALFAGSYAEPVTLDGGAGAASALKMCYAAWTKGRTALLLSVRALARAEHVDDALMAEWARALPGLQADSEAAAARVAAKAWRWVGEMEQIADSFAADGLPDGFHRAAAELYATMQGFKSGEPDFESVMAAVLDGAGRDPT
jgi:3-hydroxyisobutyrate dehydrogenase-like beta-hydroxyacid dehydrogenase